MEQEIFTQQQETGCGCCSQNEHGTKESSYGHHDMMVDLALAKEMNELTVQEREKVLDEIHGVAEEQEETPEFVQTCIEQMDSALADLPRTRRKALDRAAFLYPGLQTDIKFKLMFLRTDYFDPSRAARRMAKFFEDKLFLFGEEKLVKKITLDDLDEPAKRVFESGCCLELPHKDPTGRPIWFFDTMKHDLTHLDSVLRAGWYQIMTTMKDEVAQKKGVFNIAYAPGNILAMQQKLSVYPEFLRRSGDMIMSLPCRVTSYHFLYEDARLQSLLSVIQKYFGKHTRLRVRTHFGSPLEMQYSMMTFGVSCHALLPGGNEIDKKQLRDDYILRTVRAEAEEAVQSAEAETKTGIILYPRPSDVLVGRGRPYQDFPGNLRMLVLVDAHLDRYWICRDRFDKTCLFMDLVKQVQEYGGRFLERKPDGWRVVTDTIARDKVSSGFRTKVSHAAAAVKSEPNAKRVKR